jgi:anaerobic ribonucleoside-triphosphate reductase activating protein
LRIAYLRPATRAEGPGSRIAIWTQGCSIKCPSCFNPELWSVRGGSEYSPSELAEVVSSMVELDSEIEGVTFLGGEPFDQPGELGLAAGLIRRLGLSVMTFTGFYLKDLEDSDDAGVAKLLAETDLLVDGPFLQDLLDQSRPWLGSSNQSFHFLSDRYSAKDVEFRDALEISIKTDGSVSLNGWAPTSRIEELLEILTPETELVKTRRSVTRTIRH